MAILSANLSQDSLDRAKSFGCKTFDKPYDFELLSAWLDDQDKSLEKERRLSPLCSAMKKNDNGQTIQPRGD